METISNTFFRVFYVHRCTSSGKITDGEENIVDPNGSPPNVLNQAREHTIAGKIRLPHSKSSTVSRWKYLVEQTHFHLNDT